MDKDNWDKLEVVGKILFPVIIAIGGWYLSYIYQWEQKELAKAKLETEILKTAINGNEQERKLAIDFARFIANKFHDHEFEKIILNISYSEDNTDSVRLKARKRFLELSSTNSDPKISETAKKDLLNISLKETLTSADNFFKVQHYSEAANEYEKATSLVPFGSQIDLNTLEKAREKLDIDNEISSNEYRKFFSILR